MDAPRSTKDFAKTLRRRMSLPEVLLWRALKGRRLDGLHFRKQHPVGPYILDFYCHEQRLAVEVDGEGHSFNPEKDERRDAWLVRQGIRTLRMRAETVLMSPHDAAQTILEFIRTDAPPQGELPRSG